MVWRSWCFVSGMPLGALGAFALGGRSALALEIGAAVGAAAGFGLASWLAATRADDPERTLHLARAASVGWAGAPALGAAWLGLAPGAPALFGALLVAAGLSLWRGARHRGPAGGLPAALKSLALALGGGSVAVLLLAGVWAALGAAPHERDTSFAEAVLEHDAQVATRPLPDCKPRVAGWEILNRAGAHPRLGPRGELLWFDAVSNEGRRQVHRLTLASREVLCWTCGEPGNNRRPAPSDSGAALVYDSDRSADARAPTNTDLFFTAAEGAPGAVSSRQLTDSQGPDDHALFAPSSRSVVWSRGHDGRFEVVSAGLRTGHGALLLGQPRVLWSGGARWTAPLAWSPDARSLVLAVGHPLARQRAILLDPGTGERSVLGDDLAGASAASFSADGGWKVVSTTRGSGAAGLLPGSLGFLLARLALVLDSDGPSARGTGVRSGAARGPDEGVDLGGLESWGAPTGISLAPDATRFVLGQRREHGGHGEERLLLVTLDCRSRG